MSNNFFDFFNFAFYEVVDLFGDILIFSLCVVMCVWCLFMLLFALFEFFKFFLLNLLYESTEIISVTFSR